MNPAKDKESEETELAAVRLPKKLRAAAKSKAKKEDITFSQLMRRALRKELHSFFF
jgi:predicted HicB family RNase H-like nuclease